MVAVSVLSVVVSVAAVYCGGRAALGMARDLRATLFSRVLSWSARELAHFGPASVSTRLTNDVQQLQMLVAAGASALLLTPLTVVGGLAMAIHADVGLSWVLVVGVPVMVVAMGAVLRRMNPVSARQQAQVDRLNSVTREQVVGLRVVRAFVREPMEKARFAKVNEELTGSMLATGRLMALMMPLIILVMNVASAAVVWVGAWRVESGATTVGQIVAFLNYLGIVLVAVIMATFVASMIPRASVCARRVQEVLTTPSSLTASGHERTVLSQEVRLEAAGFCFPAAETPVLRAVDLVLRPGETTAVIGSTGAGKTTLLNLVARLVDVTEGAIRVDGVDLHRLDPDAWRQQIALVPQKAYLFSGTIATNLRAGKPTAADDELWAALEAAQAADFVRASPAGLDTRVEQGGSNLSGGQRQRICIARALVRRPNLYLFDDSFSALDLTTEARLRAALRPWTQDAAVLLVGQRIGSVASADQIVVLEAGQVVGRGTHAELVASCRTYLEIVESQAASELVR
jgi:ATP-binding cassette subfamily B protein